MDDFNNFFDDQSNSPNQRTPIYHTPEPNPPKHSPRGTAALTISIVVAVVMCVLVLVNVIVLSTLKTSIAEEYAASISESMRAQYEQAIKDALEDTDIVQDVTDNATNSAINALNTTVGKVANKCAASVARIYIFTNSTNITSQSSLSGANGCATGFLITDAADTGERYLVTNAHVVRYVKASTTGIGWQQQTRYEWATFGTLACVFEDNANVYTLEVVSYGSYSETNASGTGYYTKENDQADLAILRISSSLDGTQPDDTAHPSLKIASSTADTRGSDVATIGNPEGVGKTNSISVGTISQTGISISGWGAGSFILTDASINSGNSGGPLVNILGEVVGVVESRLVSNDIENMGFALDVETLRDFILWSEKGSNNALGQSVEITKHLITTVNYLD